MNSQPRQNPAAAGRALYADLQKLNESFGPTVNKNDRVIVLTMVCIERGANTLLSIIRFLTPLGFDNRHVAAIVKANTGNNPEAYRWTIDAAGTYHVLA